MNFMVILGFASPDLFGQPDRGWGEGTPRRPQMNNSAVTRRRQIPSIFSAIMLATAACGDGNTSDHLPLGLDAFALTTPEDTAVTETIDVINPDGNVLMFKASQPAHGMVSVTRFGMLTYTPETNYHGGDQFSLIVRDGVDNIAIDVDVMVVAVNDPPVGAADSIAATEDMVSTVTQTALLGNDADVDGDTLTVVDVAHAMNGEVEIIDGDVRFTPTTNFAGSGSFEYTLSDGTATTTATVTVTIGGQNDSPVAVDDDFGAWEDIEFSRTVDHLVGNDTDPDNQTLSVTAVGGAVNGTVWLDGALVRFTPAKDFNGTGSFTYTVSDGIATSTGTVTVLVRPFNDPPVAVDDARTVVEDGELIIDDLTANDTDIDSTDLVVAYVGQSPYGTVRLSGRQVRFLPVKDFNGTTSFDYTVSDRDLRDSGTVTVTVSPVNDAPVARLDEGTTPRNTAITFTNLTANDWDVERSSLTVTSVYDAANGSVVLNGGSPIFTPAPDFTGQATFRYGVSDGDLISLGLVSITVTP